MKYQSTPWVQSIGFAATLLFAAGCSNMVPPATATVAVSSAAVDSAASAGGSEYAPVEMNAARQKMVQARKAMAEKDYALAETLATQAQVDAKLAQSKANSAKAQLAADALQDDLRVLREELARSKK